MSVIKLVQSCLICLCFVLLVTVPNSSYALSKTTEKELKFGILAGRVIDRDVYLELLARIQAQQPEINVGYVVADDRGYKNEIENWLRNHLVDVSYGQAGTRLCNAADAGLIAPLTEVWNVKQLIKRFTDSFKRVVSCDGQPYGIPLSYYYWGFFYNKSVFKRLGISPPDTWQELLKIIEIIKQAGVTPFSIGTKNNWPTASWFDYLNLRINGLSFHLALLNGEHSFNDPRVRKVMEHWKILLSGNNFIKGKVELDWLQAMPYLYREMSAMILMGSFLPSILPKGLEDEFGFFRFPQIDANVPMYEEVPTDVYMMNTLSANKQSVHDFLAYVANEQTQAWLTDSLGYLPPHTDARVSSNRFAQIGVKHIKNAAGYSQYFDRDANPGLSAKGMVLFKEFMEHHDIDKTLQELEKLRLIQQFKEDIKAN